MPEALTLADREYIDEHCQAIARRLAAKRLPRVHWRIEIAPGYVYKIKMNGYPKKDTPWFEKRARELVEARAALEAERAAITFAGASSSA